ncbi:unnamed protein product [Ranitomeya imitator]|uniref:Chromosomal protein D1-like n=1 Tax=Ranitomeya imitator TaxID=111125 RepID=A0ABN9LS18_9NEOB|nr:unnamed protein product [Ranitomeya imitator]
MGRDRKLPLAMERSRERGEERERWWRVIMSARRLNTSSKRKRSTPQKLKSRKLFAVSGNDLSESGDGENQDFQLCLSPSPETLHNRENVPKSLHQSPSKKETPQNKENRPGQYSSDSERTQRGRGRPKGSKNKTFPTSATRVYSVREGKSPTSSPKKDSDPHQENGVTTPHRGRGRPKGSRKVIPSGENTPKRSRGRPKGSKNKKPSKASMTKVVSSGVKKAGRGRPRKVPVTNEVETPKRERGRPKGSLNKVTKAKKLTLSTGTQEKRNRGRPRKIVLHQSPVVPLGPKRPRGRPKSISKDVPVPSPELQPSEKEEYSQEEDYDKDDDDDDEEEDNDSDQ